MSDFDNVKGFGAEVDEEKAPVAKSDVHEVVERIRARRSADPEFNARYGSRSKDIIVTRILSFGKDGNRVNKTDDMIQKAVEAGTVRVLPADSTDSGAVTYENGVIKGTVKKATSGKAAYELPLLVNAKPGPDGKPKELRVLVPAPLNAGYMIKNVSSEPIQVLTAVWSKDENGHYTPQEVTQTLAPNSEMALTKEYLTKLAVQPEFNMTLGNGTVNARTKGIKDPADALKSGYFQFNTDTGYDVNSPEVKSVIHEAVEVNGETQYRVAAEWEPTFGYLNETTSDKEKKKPREKSNRSAISSQEITAERLRSMLGM